MYQRIEGDRLLELLRDLSPGDAEFDARKVRNLELAARLSRVMPGEGKVLYNCINSFTMAVTGDGLKLHQAMKYGVDGRMYPSVMFCKRRYCPICAPRRARKFLAIFLSQKDKLLERFSLTDYKWFMGTVTVANPLLGDMKSTVQAMNKGFAAMNKPYLQYAGGKCQGNRSWPFTGVVRSLEITPGNILGRCHPHNHFFGLGRIDALPSWTEDNYQSSLWLSQQYQKYMKLDYLPQCELHEVLPRERADGSITDPLTAALLEVCKYCVKIPDILTKDELDYQDAIYRQRPFEEWDFTPQFIKQMKGQRMIFKSGVLRDYFGDDREDEDLVKVADEETVAKVDEIWDFVWNTKYSHHGPTFITDGCNRLLGIDYENQSPIYLTAYRKAN